MCETKFYLVFMCVLGAAYAQVPNAIQVNTTQGLIQGASATDGNYFTFFDIHYGGSVSGVNRFKAAPPPPPYPGTYHAINSNIQCAQPTARGLVGIEDCLTLSVFSNNVNSTNPVVVWLVSEEYTTTETVPSFNSLVTEGVVVVQLNYRLSIFGFLCLGVAEAPGNAGLRDVVQGLRWINQNIAAFGGDPNNVILFGHGSGAAMVDLITMSPLATNLVHKAVAQSGSALSPWAIAYNPVESAQAVGAKLGYTQKTNEELARLLASSDLTVLTNTLNEFEFLNNTVLFAPCIEDVTLNPNDTFLAAAPITLLREGNYSHIPYIAGYTDREGTLRAEEAAYNDWLTKMQTNFTNFLQVDLDFGTNLTSVERTIRDYYFGQRIINMETIEDFLDYHGDTMILVSVIRGARERAATSRSQVRLYGFEYRGTQNSDWAFNTIPVTGARHGAVLNYLLGNDLRPVIDEPVATSLRRRYLAFFNTGVPNPTTPGALWEPVTSTTTNYLLYSGGGEGVNHTVHTEEARVNPHQQRMTFWDDLYFKYYMAPRPVSSGVRIFGVALLLLLGQLFVRML